MKEKVVHYTEVKLEKVVGEDTSKTSVRWLISDKDEAPTFAIRLFTIEQGGNSPYHKHSWEHEIFILEGEGEIIIGEKSYHISPGYVVFIPPNIKHTIRNHAPKTLKFLCLIPIKR